MSENLLEGQRPAFLVWQQCCCSRASPRHSPRQVVASSASALGKTTLLRHFGGQLGRTRSVTFDGQVVAHARNDALYGDAGARWG